MTDNLRGRIYNLLRTKEICWLSDKTLGIASRLYRRHQRLRTRDEVAIKARADSLKKCDALFSDKIVRNGPFKGMKYPTNRAIGSNLYPKLLGSYEKELTIEIEFIVQQKYDAVVDIGCAEGYYAVGFGTRCKNSRIHAFDTNTEAIDLCNRMARLNSVDLTTHSFCDKRTLLELDLGRRSLIFCDCEGYEYELFDRELASHLRRHDLLIETHDFINIDTTDYLMQTLSTFHDCKLIESIDDIIKCYTYEFEELRGFSRRDKREILSEGRPQIMRWIFARPRSRVDAC